MRRVMYRIAGLICAMSWAVAAHAEALVDLSGIEAQSRWRGAEITVPLSDPAAWRAYVTPGEPALIIAWQGEANGDINPLPERRFGPATLTVDEGWSRLAIPLERRMIIAEAALVERETWQLNLSLRRARQAAYDKASLNSPDTDNAPVVEGEGPPRLVVIDPGHGGRDPGAIHGGLAEKEITLDLALRLEAALAERGIATLLTREEDRFIPLDERVAIARGAGANLMVSLHADAFDDPTISGSSVYTLSQASVPEDAADDFTDGLVPAGTGQDLSEVLVTMARRGSVQQANRTRLRLLRSLEAAGISLNRSPVRNAGFRVLQAPDVPSLLIEFGYMSNATDRDRLSDPAWRARAAVAVAEAIAGGP